MYIETEIILYSYNMALVSENLFNLSRDLYLKYLLRYGMRLYNNIIELEASMTRRRYSDMEVYKYIKDEFSKGVEYLQKEYFEKAIEYCLKVTNTKNRNILISNCQSMLDGLEFINVLRLGCDSYMYILRKNPYFISTYKYLNQERIVFTFFNDLNGIGILLESDIICLKVLKPYNDEELRAKESGLFPSI